MDTLRSDLRYAIRTLRKSPAFTAVAILTLALGVGANTAIFSVVNGVLLGQLPFREPDRLVQIGHSYPKLKVEAPVSAPGYFDYQAQTQVFERAGLMAPWNANLSGDGEPERLLGARVTASYFPTLGVAPQRGRGFTADEERPEQNRSIIISHGLWQRRFGGDPAVVGRTVQINGQAHQIVGIMPEGFQVSTTFDVWAPLAFTPEELAPDQRTNEYLGMVARLKPGVTVEQAQAALNALSGRLKAQFPDEYLPEWRLSVTPLREALLGDIRPALLVLLGAVAFVLLIACANVANLMLARAAAREKEIAIRTALGAGRGRLIRQLLTESIVIALLGGAGGLALAMWGTDALVALGPADLPRAHEIGIDGRVLGFTLGVALLTGVLFGLAPAVGTLQQVTPDVLKEGGRSSAPAFGRGGVRRVLVVSEVALALILLVGAGLMIRTVANLQRIDPGFRTDNVLTMQVALPAATYAEESQQARFYQELTREIAALPGVRSAGAVSNLPMTGAIWTGSFAVEGYEVSPGSSGPHGDLRIATPDYFRTLGIPLLRGRLFTEQDDAKSRPVAIIDERLAKRYWPSEDPIGKRVGFQVTPDSTAWREVVGVVGHVMNEAVEQEPRTQLYLPHAQVPAPGMFLVVRTASDPLLLVPAVRRAVRQVDEDQPVFDVTSMDQHFASSVAQPRFTMLLLSLFATLALLLAAVGIYGVMSYAVAQRTHEVGIRMALGAGQRRVLGLVLKQGMTLVLVGVGGGLVGALVLTRVVASQLYAVSPSDPQTFAGVSLILVGVALLATYLPARRATRVDAMVALRYE